MNEKLRVGLVFGGRSAEHEVSIVSAHSVFKALDKEKILSHLFGLALKENFSLLMILFFSKERRQVT